MKKRYVILAALLGHCFGSRLDVDKKRREDTGKDGPGNRGLLLRIQIQLQVMTVPW